MKLLIQNVIITNSMILKNINLYYVSDLFLKIYRNSKQLVYSTIKQINTL